MTPEVTQSTLSFTECLSIMKSYSGSEDNNWVDRKASLFDSGFNA